MSTATASQPSSSQAALGAIQVQPYLMFNGRTEEALEFYRRALGAEITMLMRFKEAPPPPPDSGMCAPPAGIENKVMHASFRVGATDVLASDGRCDGAAAFQNFALSLTVKTPADAERAFNALGDGGKVEMPLGKTFFSESFGMLADRFGVAWMIYVAPKTA